MALLDRNPRRFVDLSIYLENDVASDPPGMGPTISYENHDQPMPVFEKLITGHRARPWAFTDSTQTNRWSTSCRPK